MFPPRTGKILIAVVLSGVFAAACSPFAPRPRAAPEEDLPETYSLYTGETEAERRWWYAFSDPELNRLVETALADGLSIQEAWARLNQARAVAVQAGAARYPDLTAEGSALLGRQKSSSAAGSRQLEQAGIGLASRYEIDLWGRVAAGREAALLGAAAAREDLNTAAVTLSAEVASRWIGIISQRMQKDLIEEQLKINRTFLELVELRFKTAMVSALDVYQQKQVVENLEAELPLV